MYNLTAAPKQSLLFVRASLSNNTSFYRSSFVIYKSLAIYLFAYLPVRLPTCQSICSPLSLSASLSHSLTLCHSACLSSNLLTYLAVCLCINLRVFLSAFLPTYQSARLSVSLLIVSFPILLSICPSFYSPPFVPVSFTKSKSSYQHFPHSFSAFQLLTISLTLYR